LTTEQVNSCWSSSSSVEFVLVKMCRR